MNESPTQNTLDERERFFGWVTRLVHQHRSLLTGIARNEGLNTEDALDCMQEAFQSFLVLPQARLLVETPEDSAKILVVLTRNLARNRRRKHDRSKPHISDDMTLEMIDDEDTSADEVVMRADAYATMTGCIATLNEIQRAVVQLRLVDEIPGEDVAKQLNTTPGNIAILLHRAKQKLRACFDH